MIGFERLEVWKSGCRLAVDVYQKLRDCRDFGLKDQMQRSAVSIPSNIAEGSERHTAKDFKNFLYVAKGSCAELQTQIYIAGKIGVIPRDSVQEMITQCKNISCMLQKLISSIPDKP